jgi:hypothetical protein
MLDEEGGARDITSEGGGAEICTLSVASSTHHRDFGFHFTKVPHTYSVSRPLPSHVSLSRNRHRKIIVKSMTHRRKKIKKNVLTPQHTANHFRNKKRCFLRSQVHFTCLFSTCGSHFTPLFPTSTSSSTNVHFTCLFSTCRSHFTPLFPTFHKQLHCVTYIMIHIYIYIHTYIYIYIYISTYRRLIYI